MSNKLGVIGGLGTETAAQFYIEAELIWKKSGELSHIPLMLENIQSSLDLELSIIESTTRIGELESFLQIAARNLEKGGASLVVVPCNTAHALLESTRAAIEIPMLSITEEVAKVLEENQTKAAAILGTRTTKETGIYEEACHSRDIEVLYPSEVDQQLIEKTLQRTLSWENNEEDSRAVVGIIDRVKKAGADSVVLACTDLQLLMPGKPVAGVFDSMRILAKASVRELRASVARS